MTDPVVDRLEAAAREYMTRFLELTREVAAAGLTKEQKKELERRLAPVLTETEAELRRLMPEDF